MLDARPPIGRQAMERAAGEEERRRHAQRLKLGHDGSDVAGMIVVERQRNARTLAPPCRFEQLPQRHDVADAEQCLQLADETAAVGVTGRSGPVPYRQAGLDGRAGPVIGRDGPRVAAPRAG